MRGGGRGFIAPYIFFTRTVDGGEWLASSPDALSSVTSRTQPLSGILGGHENRCAHFGGEKIVLCVLAFGSSMAPWGFVKAGELRDRPDGWERLKKGRSAARSYWF
jgi:hypothetical protein